MSERDISDAEVTAVWNVLAEEVDLGGWADSTRFTSEQIHAGELRKADEAEERRVADLIRRALAAAYEVREGHPDHPEGRKP